MVRCERWPSAQVQVQAARRRSSARRRVAVDLGPAVDQGERRTAIARPARSPLDTCPRRLPSRRSGPPAEDPSTARRPRREHSSSDGAMAPLSPSPLQRANSLCDEGRTVRTQPSSYLAPRRTIRSTRWQAPPPLTTRRLSSNSSCTTKRQKRTIRFHLRCHSTARDLQQTNKQGKKEMIKVHGTVYCTHLGTNADCDA